MLYDINGINENTDNKNVIPMVIETSARGERAFDIYSLLLQHNHLRCLNASLASDLHHNT